MVIEDIDAPGVVDEMPPEPAWSRELVAWELASEEAVAVPRHHGKRGADSLGIMSDLHVRISEDLAERLALEARHRGVGLDQLVTEAIQTHLPPAGAGLGFVGIGQAKPGFSVRVAEERMEAEGLV